MIIRSRPEAPHHAASLCLLLLLVLICQATPVWADRMLVRTTAGDIEIDLLEEHAPATVEQIRKHARADFYNGLIFHRLNPGFVIQTGGYDANDQYREPMGTVENESVGGLRNTLGTVGLARHSDPDSGDAQFYFNLRDSRHLDALRKRPGYTVFGRVTAGWEVVEAISEMPTRDDGSWPLEPILINTVEINADPP